MSTTFPDSSHVGYTVVFKNDVTEETVMKYMADVVEAGGRLTQTYDWFLNVRIVFGPRVSCWPALTWHPSQGFCAAIPEDHLQYLNKISTDVDYIGECFCTGGFSRVFLTRCIAEPEGLPRRH
jgi:hypothetical protein